MVLRIIIISTQAKELAKEFPTPPFACVEE